MALTHEFGIVKDIPEKSYMNYAHEKYQCISVDDEVITNLMGPLSLMKTYFHSLNRPAYGLRITVLLLFHQYHYLRL